MVDGKYMLSRWFWDEARHQYIVSVEIIRQLVGGDKTGGRIEKKS